MKLRVLGCHGGETPQHRTSSFVLDGVLGVDAGAVTSMLTLPEQMALEAILVSHAHLDHVRDLATLADNRCQSGDRPLLVAGTRFTIEALQRHFFNNVLWPDFASIPLVRGGGVTIEYQVLEPEVPTTLAGFEAKAVLVAHTIESAGFVVEKQGAALGYSGDTGPTRRFWEVLRATPTLKALLMEVSFPNEYGWLASRSGHHTPASAEADLRLLDPPGECSRLPVVFYHIKPCFQGEVERELASIRGRELDVASLGDELEL